jgi:prephenate dehydrogenase
VSAGSSKKEIYFENVALIGAGLIGGSITLALREKNLVEKVICYDLDLQAGQEAVEKGAADLSLPSAAEAVKEADLVILAIPVLKTLELLKEIIPVVKPGALITDVGSTKGAIMAAVEQILPPSIYYIGGHPMAGSEESGIRGSDSALLENAIYVLTPEPDTPKEILDKLCRMLAEAGAEPIVIDPLNHDRVVALVSHLPHLAAAALVQSVADAGDAELIHTLAAGGFRDSTRIALGNPEVWRDICISNRWALLSALKIFRKSLDTVEKYLTEQNGEAVHEYLQRAQEYRSSVPHRGRGILPEIYEMVVLVKDTPGAIAQVTGLLSQEAINIDAIEIIHIRELSGGSLRLGFRSKESRKKAFELLNKQGYTTHVRE